MVFIFVAIIVVVKGKIFAPGREKGVSRQQPHIIFAAASTKKL